MDAHYDKLNDSIDKFSFGRHALPVSLILSPEDKYRARVAKQENVDALERSMQTFGTLNDRVEVVLFLAANKALPAKVGFRPPLTQEDLKARGFEGYFTIVGDHTQRALHQLHKRYPANPKWATITATVYLCHRTAEVYSALKSWGLLDNIKGEARVAVSFADKIASLHEDYLALAEHERTPGHKERTAALKARRAKDFGDISAGQIMQLWSIAARSGPVWDNLWLIISGQVTPPPSTMSLSRRRGGKQRPPRVKTVKSAANFTNIGGVDDETLTELLHEVVVGHSSLQKLNEQCGLHKARVRVQTVVMSDPSLSEFDDWTEARKKFPMACDEEFVSRWTVTLVREGVGARQELPPLFYEELDRRVKLDVNAVASTRAALAVGHAFININGSRSWSLILMVCCLTCVRQVLPASDRVFATTLHNMEVKLICHDALHLAQLMGQIARAYGAVLSVVFGIWPALIFCCARVMSAININGCLLCRACLLGHAVRFGPGALGRDADRRGAGGLLRADCRDESSSAPLPRLGCAVA